MKLGEITGPLIELLHDAEMSEKLLTERDDQFSRRSYIRASISAMEGIVWLLKQICIKASKEAHFGLSFGEYAMLVERTGEVEPNGEVKLRTKLIKLESNLLFTVRMCNRIFRTSVDLRCDTASWEKFRKTIKIRNRITHPKSIEELHITDGEILMCKEIIGWFNDRIFEFVEDIQKKSVSLSEG